MSPSSKTQSIGPKQFPWKLHEMLETAEKNGDDHIVSWMPDGRSFRVHDRELFVGKMMKMFFNQTKYKSFQRQLNLWGFERISNRDPNEKGAYYHPLFLKGRRDLCPCMTRQKSAQLPGPNETEPTSQPGSLAPNHEMTSPAGQTQNLNAQAVLATRNMSNAELIAMLTGSQAPPVAMAPSAPKDYVSLQQALLGHVPERPAAPSSQNINDQIALLLQQSLEYQSMRPDLRLAAMIAQRREQEAELAAILALAANRSVA